MQIVFALREEVRIFFFLLNYIIYQCNQHNVFTGCCRINIFLLFDQDMKHVSSVLLTTKPLAAVEFHVTVSFVHLVMIYTKCLEKILNTYKALRIK